jgi:hypothetical protein
MKNLIAFMFVGIAFLVLFLPYLLWKIIETRINGLLSETVIVSRLGGMALRDMFREENWE